MKDKKFTFNYHDEPADVVNQINDILRERFSIEIEVDDGDMDGKHNCEIKIMKHDEK